VLKKIGNVKYLFLKLYDKVFFKEIGNGLKNINFENIFRSVRYITVPILFAITWANLLFSNPGFGLMIIPIGIVLPIVLLILVIQYKNRFALLMVTYIFQLNVFHEFESFFSDLYLFYTEGNVMHTLTGSPLMRIQDAMFHIPLSFLALIIIGVIIRSEKFNISQKLYGISMVCALGLVLLRPVAVSIISNLIGVL